jgi:hypothetical protein
VIVSKAGTSNNFISKISHPQDANTFSIHPVVERSLFRAEFNQV